MKHGLLLCRLQLYTGADFSLSFSEWMGAYKLMLPTARRTH